MPRKEMRIPTVLADEDVTILENALLQMLGVSQVDYYPETKVVAVQWSDPASWDEIERKLETLGYFPEEAR
jgi:hypothetical protein